MKKILAILLITMMCAFVSVNTSLAKDAQLQIEFTLDVDFEYEIAEYGVYVEAEGSPGSLVEVQTVTDATVRIIDTPVIDLLPGRTTNIYVSARYTDGQEVMSDPFPWKFTGKPFIIRVNKI